MAVTDSTQTKRARPNPKLETLEFQLIIEDKSRLDSGVQPNELKTVV